KTWAPALSKTLKAHTHLLPDQGSNGRAENLERSSFSYVIHKLDQGRKTDRVGAQPSPCPSPLNPASLITT
ncbi:hypothetical protein KC19_1G215200, partial [Ceratodon purpureus]